MGSSWNWFLVLLLACSAHAQTQYVRKHCLDTDFETAGWPALSADIVFSEWMKSLDRNVCEMTGKRVSTLRDLDNCTIEYPVDDQGKAKNGRRIAILDKYWVDRNGDQYEMGLKIVYKHIVKEGATQRVLLGYTYCQNPTACEILGIPKDMSPTK